VNNLLNLVQDSAAIIIQIQLRRGSRGRGGDIFAPSAQHRTSVFQATRRWALSSEIALALFTFFFLSVQPVRHFERQRQI
jgi:hypothetical protein